MNMMPCPPPICDPASLDLDQLCDLVQMQQQTISFLINQYNTVLAFVQGQSGQFGQPLAVIPAATIKAGWWMVITPTTGIIAHIPVVGSGSGAQTNVAINAPGIFWSDGTVVAAANLVISALAQPMPVTTP